MINITDKNQCCGCNACGDICPKNAITYNSDIEGFAYPVVNINKCIDCFYIIFRINFIDCYSYFIKSINT